MFNGTLTPTSPSSTYTKMNGTGSWHRRWKVKNCMFRHAISQKESYYVTTYKKGQPLIGHNSNKP